MRTTRILTLCFFTLLPNINAKSESSKDQTLQRQEVIAAHQKTKANENRSEAWIVQTIDTTHMTLPRSNDIIDVALDGDFREGEYSYPFISNDPIHKILCENNEEGNYQNPDNCHEFIMCDEGGTAWVMECPFDGGIYVPSPDLCGYGGGFDKCPWKTARDEYFKYPSCKTLGQRSWSLMTLPVYPGITCGFDIMYCKNFTDVIVRNNRLRCPDWFGYSWAYNGCLPAELCLELEAKFFPREM